MTRALLLLVVAAAPGLAQVAVRGEMVYTMAGPPIADGVVLIRDGKIVAAGSAASVAIPEGFRVLQAKIVTPGLVDAHSTIGLSGFLNQRDDQEQLERSASVQPQLRALDAYNPRDPLVGWALGYGVTTLHTGHAPGALVAGQTMIVKTRGGTVEEALVEPLAMIAATLGDSARADGGKSPGTRAKMAAMLRSELLEAQRYANKLAKAEEGKEPPRDLRLEALARTLAGETPLLITVQRSRDILTALRIREEFGNFPMVLDGAAEAYDVLDEIKAAGVPVILHATMYRTSGETENLSFETASKLRAAGIPFALQSGFEPYVPKSRLVLFEAALAAANGLTREQALASITIDAARILGVARRVGSLEAGKDGDVALYDGDPFEYTSHCVGAILDGVVVSEETH